MSEQQVQTQPQSDAPCLNQPFWAILMESIAHLDIVDRLDAWFGHWWNRPFWKADNPLQVFLENLTWQGHVRFALPRVGETTGYEAEVFLRNHGVYVWGRFFDCENVYFNVKKEQASWAEYLLEREGIATANTPVDPRNRVWAEPYDKAPPGWGSNRRTFGDMLGVLSPHAARYRPKTREWPTGQDGKGGRRKPAPATRRRRRTKKQQTPVQRLAREVGQRMNRRRPRRPARPGNRRQR